MMQVKLCQEVMVLLQWNDEGSTVRDTVPTMPRGGSDFLASHGMKKVKQSIIQVKLCQEEVMIYLQWNGKGSVVNDTGQTMSN